MPAGRRGLSRRHRRGVRPGDRRQEPVHVGPFGTRRRACRRHWRAAWRARRPRAAGCAARRFLHDVGKLGVSNAILDKPAGLDDRRMGGDARSCRAYPRNPRPDRRLRRSRRHCRRAPRAARRRAAIRSGSTRRADRARNADHHRVRFLRRADRRPPVSRGAAARRGAGDHGRRGRHGASTANVSRRCAPAFASGRPGRAYSPPLLGIGSAAAATTSSLRSR